MATNYITQYIDDLDGTELGSDGHTIRFSLEGRSYEIDLSPENASKLNRALAPFIDAGRASTPSRRASSRGKRGVSSLDLTSVRAWARANGHTVSDRGRVPTAVLEAYRATN